VPRDPEHAKIVPSLALQQSRTRQLHAVFDKVKKPEQDERKLDLSGLTMQPPPVPADKEQRAITKGEEFGFTSREPSETKEPKAQGKGRVMRRRERTPTRSIYVQGPASVLDRFVAYTS
jgi:hypothetical protein